MKFIFDDGGRAEAGYKGNIGDCVVRSIAIAVGLPYQQVYDDLRSLNKAYARERRNTAARSIKRGGSPRDGNWRQVYEPYLASFGFVWHPTMLIGRGCKVHLKANELPKGNLVVSVSRHLTAVLNGVMHDTEDHSRGGTRCVYGYYKRID